ncbi:MAG: DUF1974 domain-containing protein, partial [Proteobacteria bacterium]|nr:DUF1974 domain-containing protein [Pseudomonadota bacterium]
IETVNGKTLHGIRVSFNDLIMLGLESSTLFYLAINVTDFANELSNKTRLGTALCLFDTKKSNIQIKAGNKAYMGLLKYYRCSAKNIFIPLNQIIGGFNAVNDGIKHLYQLQSNASKIWPSAVSLPIQFQSTFISWYFAHIKKQNGRALLNYRLVRKQLNRQFGHFLRNQLTHQYALSQFNAEQSLSYCNILFKNLVLNDTLKQLGWLRTILGSHAHNIKDQNHMSNFFKVMHLSMELDGDSHEINQLPLMKKVALASHPWYALEIELLTKNQLDTKKLDYYLFKHFGYISHNMAKIWVQTLKTSWLGRLIFRRKKQQNYIRSMSSTFAFIADLSLIKWSLKKESNTEFTGYLAQCNQQLITLMALLNQYQKEETNDARKFILKQSMRDCFFISQTTINQCINSAFGRFSALILKVMIFPLGKPFHQASFSSTTNHVLTDSCQLNNAFQMENQLLNEISNTSEKLISVITIENAVRNATGSAITTKNHHTLIDRTLAAGIISVDQAEKIRDAYDSILNLQLINHFGQNNEK